MPPPSLPSVAASIYGAHILQRSIEDDRRNFTRFFLLYPSKRTRLPRREAKAWKTSLVFTTRNIPGALFRALSAFALRDLNLTKIESRPLHGKPWEYLFYLDFLDKEDDPKFKTLCAIWPSWRISCECWAPIQRGIENPGDAQWCERRLTTNPTYRPAGRTRRAMRSW